VRSPGFILCYPMSTPIRLILLLILSLQIAKASLSTSWMDESKPAKDTDATLLLLHLDDGTGHEVKDDNSSGRQAADVALTGEPVPVWDEGYFGKGLHLQEGKTNGVQIDPSVLENPNTRIGFFFKWDYIFKSNPGYFFNCPGEIFARAQLVENGAQPATIRVNFGIKKADDTYLEILSPEENSLDDKWHYLEFVRAWDGTLLEGIVFLDGERIASDSAQTPPISSNKPLFFGSDGTENSIGGSFDEIRIGTPK
jgi:hypothetical protein